MYKTIKKKCDVVQGPLDKCILKINKKIKLIINVLKLIYLPIRFSWFNILPLDRVTITVGIAEFQFVYFLKNLFKVYSKLK